MTFNKWVMGCLLCSFLFSGCSVDHSSTDVGVDIKNDNIISGVVLAGGPVKGTVSLLNGPNNISSEVDIDENGNFTVRLLDFWTGPYILQARGTVGGRYVCLHSLGTREDVSETVNITPLTNLITGNVVGKNPENYYENISSPKMSVVVTQENLHMHEELVKNRFASMLGQVLDDLENFNLMNTPIQDERHTKIDVLFDFLRITSNRDEDGNLLDSMSITTLLSDDAPVVDDLTDPSDNDSIPPLPDAFEDASLQMYEIVDRFAYWESFFAESLPDENDVNLKSIFSDDFLYNGYVRDSVEGGQEGFLEMISNISSMEEMKITGVALDNIDLGSDTEPPTATVSFSITNGEGRQQSFYGWQMELIGGRWRIKGNQQQLAVYAGTYLAYSTSENDVLTYDEVGTNVSNGLVLYAYAPVPGISDGVEYMLVTGPGIVDSLRLDKYDDLSRVELFDDGSNVDSPDNVIVYANKSITGKRPDGFYEPKDNTGLANPLSVIDNSEYVFTLYQDGLPVGVYTTILKRGNKSTDYYEDLDNEDRFFVTFYEPDQPELNNPDINFDDYVKFEWELPRSMHLLSFNYFLTFEDGGIKTSEYIKLLDSSSHSFSKTLNNNIIRLDVYLRTVDSLDRIIDTFYSKLINVDDDLVTQPITVIEKNPVF